MVVTGVSAHLELFVRAARARRADGALPPRAVLAQAAAGARRAAEARLKALFDADLSLAAYHLPLDAHPEVGNNALICAALGLERAEPFGRTTAGRSASSAARPSRSRATSWSSAAGARSARTRSRSSTARRRCAASGVVSGGGASSLAEAIERGLDAMISGEPSEPAMAEAREAGITFIAGGHWATETFGVRRLGELLAERFGVEHRFMAVPNPV